LSMPGVAFHKEDDGLSDVDKYCQQTNQHNIIS
jgi:hypothetical protein